MNAVNIFIENFLNPELVPGSAGMIDIKPATVTPLESRTNGKHIPFFSDLPVVQEKEAGVLYDALFHITADKFKEAPLLKAVYYLHHISQAINNPYDRYSHIAQQCLEWIEKNHMKNKTVGCKNFGWMTESGLIVPYQLFSVTHPLIKAGFVINIPAYEDKKAGISDVKSLEIQPLEQACVFELFGHDFTKMELIPGIKAAQLLKKMMRNINKTNRNQKINKRNKGMI